MSEDIKQPNRASRRAAPKVPLVKLTKGSYEIHIVERPSEGSINLSMHNVIDGTRVFVPLAKNAPLPEMLKGKS